MQITQVRVRKPETEGKVKAYVSITIDNCFVIHECKLIKTQSGSSFLAFPSKKIGEEYKDIMHPINQETRKEFENKVKEAYKNEFGEE